MRHEKLKLRCELHHSAKSPARRVNAKKKEKDISDVLRFKALGESMGLNLLTGNVGAIEIFFTNFQSWLVYDFEFRFPSDIRKVSILAALYQTQ